MISFRVGYTDGAVLTREFGDTYPPKTFVDLERYQVLVKLMENGANREPFQAQTLSPIASSAGRKEKLLTRSREKYAIQRKKIERKLEAWMKRSTNS